MTITATQWKSYTMGKGGEIMKDYQKRAIKKYQEAHYEFIKVRFKKGEADKIREAAKAAGKSINEYCLEKLMGDII